MEGKKCIKCGIFLFLDINIIKSVYNKKHYICNFCRKINRDKYILENKNKLKELNKLYYIKNKEYFQEYKKNWFQKNKELLMPKYKIYRKGKKEELLLYYRNYYKNNDLLKIEKKIRRKFGFTLPQKLIEEKKIEITILLQNISKKRSNILSVANNSLTNEQNN